MQFFQGTTFSELAALITIITVLGGALAWLIKQHHEKTFLKKSAYYAQREEDRLAAKEVKAVEVADTKEHREKVLEQMEEMNTNFKTFMEKIAEWKSEFHTRVSLIEDRQKRRGGRRSTDN